MYNHRNESAHPGYYQVYLERYGINVELTSTLRCAFHKYQFKKSQHKSLLVNLAMANEKIKNWDIHQENANAFSGFQQGGEKIYFYAISNHTIRKIDSLSKDSKFLPIVHFFDTDQNIELQIGFSYVSVKNAEEKSEKGNAWKEF